MSFTPESPCPTCHRLAGEIAALRLQLDYLTAIVRRYRGEPVESLGCLAPACGSLVYLRGLCTKHYNRACLDVRSGKTTWEALIAQNRAKPSRQRKAAREWNGAQPAFRQSQ